MIIPSFYPAIGGEEIQVQWLARASTARGRRVRVLTHRHGSGLASGLPSNDSVDGTPITRIYSRGPWKLGSMLYVFGALWHLTLGGRKGVYSAHAEGAAGVIAIAARYLLGGVSLITLRSGSSVYNQYLSRWLTRWYFLAQIRMTDKVIVLNREVERLVRSLGVPARRVTLIPTAVDTEYFCAASTERKSAARKLLNLPTNKTIALYVGRLVPEKGLDLLVRAWALLPERIRASAVLLVVGDGEERVSLQQSIESLGLSPYVRLVGQQRSVRNYYWAADIMVLPSRTEGMSSALLEAMACALPPVASNVGGAVDIVEEGRNGVMFESGDCHQLAQKLESLMGALPILPRMGASARQTVARYADLEATADRIQELHTQLVSSR